MVAHRLFRAGLEAQTTDEGWIAFRQFGKAYILGDARMRHAEGSILAPGGLEWQGIDILRHLDAEAVVDIDERAVARGRTIIASVVGTYHVNAGGMQILHRHIRSIVPGTITQQDAL